jgi:hypothetical protein
MPGVPFAKPLASRAPLSRTSAVGEPGGLSSEPGVRAQNLSTHTAKHSPQTVEAPQQFIVFTAWEQVETSVPTSQTVADYDTNPTADTSTTSNAGSDASAKSDTSKSAEKQTPDRLTVTRLIFRIVPANANSSQPTAIPIGWFVIQL